MPPSNVSSLNTLAQLVLTTARACLATTAAGTPDTYYVAPAAPAFDCCPALIVHVASLTEESTSPLSPQPATGSRAKYGRINLAGMVVTALRCAPKVQQDGSVRTTDIEAVALEVQEDAWALWCGFYWAIQNETFLGLCSDVHFDRGVSIAEQGGCVGWTFNFRAQLDGIPNPGPST
jgi:hypothetical protein